MLTNLQNEIAFDKRFHVHEVAALRMMVATQSLRCWKGKSIDMVSQFNKIPNMVKQLS